MKIINRYLSQNIFYSTISVITILSAIILITQSLKYIDLIVSHGIALFDFIKISFLLIPSLLFLIIPICLYVALIYSLNKLYSSRELNVLKTSGMSNFQISKPILKITLILTVFNFFISLYFLPIANNIFKNLTSNLKENYITFFLQEKVFSHPTKNMTFFNKNKIDNNTFEDIFYQDKEGDNNITLIAKSGELIKKNNKLFLNLKNGNRQEINKKGELTVLYFNKLRVEIKPKKNQNILRSETIQETDILSLIFSNDSISKQQKNKMRSEASQRIIWPLYNIILTFLALNIFLCGSYSRLGKIKRIFSHSIIAALIVLLNSSLFNLSAKYNQFIFLNIAITLLLIFGFSHFLFRREKYEL